MVTAAQRSLGLRTTFYCVMIAWYSSRYGCPHKTQGLPPGSTSSSTIVPLPWYAYRPSPSPHLELLPLTLLTGIPPSLCNFCNCRAIQQLSKNYSIEAGGSTSAYAYTKIRCGACMRCRTTCYRRPIRSWRRTVRRSPLVRTFP